MVLRGQRGEGRASEKGDSIPNRGSRWHRGLHLVAHLNNGRKDREPGIDDQEKLPKT